jgi:hypothetical protein
VPKFRQEILIDPTADDLATWGNAGFYIVAALPDKETGNHVVYMECELGA